MEKLREREYTSLKEIMFCPNCRRQVSFPIFGLKLEQIKGAIRINCGRCRKGIVIIQGKKR